VTSFGTFNKGRNPMFVKRCAICDTASGETRSYKTTLDQLGLTERKTDQAHSRCVIAYKYKRGRKNGRT
jgi:hypothetical protein